MPERKLNNNTTELSTSADTGDVRARRQRLAQMLGRLLANVWLQRRRDQRLALAESAESSATTSASEPSPTDH